MSDLAEANMQDLPAENLKPQLGDVRARSCAAYDAEYGIREDDGAQVFHFFPPGYAANDRVEWNDWTSFRDRLERLIVKYFDRHGFQAGYVPELRSFFVIVPNLRVPDPVSLLESFFRDLEAGS